MCYYDKKEILSKDVYFVQNHQYVLLPWWKKYKEYGKLNLITIDTHTDTVDAFRKYLTIKEPEILANRDFYEIKDEYIKQLPFDNIKDIECAIFDLNNDEHIDLAVIKTIFDKVFVISNNTEHYRGKLVDNIFGTDISFYEKSDGGRASEYKITKERSILEEIILELYLKELEDQSKIYPLDKPYVLDIDLDFFKYKKWLYPKNKNIFYKLIKNSEYITIAIEEYFLKIESEGRIMFEDAIKSIEYHIKKAQESLV